MLSQVTIHSFHWIRIEYLPWVRWYLYLIFMAGRYKNDFLKWALVFKEFTVWQVGAHRYLQFSVKSVLNERCTTMISKKGSTLPGLQCSKPFPDHDSANLERQTEIRYGKGHEFRAEWTEWQTCERDLVWPVYRKHRGKGRHEAGWVGRPCVPLWKCGLTTRTRGEPVG